MINIHFLYRRLINEIYVQALNFNTVPSAGNKAFNLTSREVRHAEGREHLHGLLVDADLLHLERRLLRDEVHAALALLLLELERDAADGAALDAAHQVGGEAGHLVTEALRGQDRDLLQHLLVGVEVEGHAGGAKSSCRSVRASPSRCRHDFTRHLASGGLHTNEYARYQE